MTNQTIEQIPPLADRLASPEAAFALDGLACRIALRADPQQRDYYLGLLDAVERGSQDGPANLLPGDRAAYDLCVTILESLYEAPT